MSNVIKSDSVRELKKQFDSMSSALFIDYKSMKVPEITLLRRIFSENSVVYNVAKNKLIQRSLQGSVCDTLPDGTLVGMTGIAWSFQHPSAAVKVLQDFKKKFNLDRPVIKSCIVDGFFLNAKKTEEVLLTLPSKEELRILLLCTLSSHPRSLINLLYMNSQKFVYLLMARINQQAC